MLESFFLFDRMVVPILLYGAELWGYEQIDLIENRNTVNIC